MASYQGVILCASTTVSERRWRAAEPVDDDVELDREGEGGEVHLALGQRLLPHNVARVRADVSRALELAVDDAHLRLRLKLFELMILTQSVDYS